MGADRSQIRARADCVLDVVYSQPADTGTGVNINTQLVYAVDHLKVCHALFSIEVGSYRLKQNGNPMRLEDLAIITNTSLINDRVLFEKFKHHDRVSYDPKTDLFSYKVCFYNAALYELTSFSTILMSDRNLNFSQLYSGRH